MKFILLVVISVTIGVLNSLHAKSAIEAKWVFKKVSANSRVGTLSLYLHNTSKNEERLKTGITNSKPSEMFPPVSAGYGMSIMSSGKLPSPTLSLKRKNELSRTIELPKVSVLNPLGDKMPKEMNQYPSVILFKAGESKLYYSCEIPISWFLEEVDIGGSIDFPALVGKGSVKIVVSSFERKQLRADKMVHQKSTLLDVVGKRTAVGKDVINYPSMRGAKIAFEYIEEEQLSKTGYLELNDVTAKAIVGRGYVNPNGYTPLLCLVYEGMWPNLEAYTIEGKLYVYTYTLKSPRNELTPVVILLKDIPQEVITVLDHQGW